MSDKFKKQRDIDITEAETGRKRSGLDLISRRDVLALAKDVTLQNGCKHRCIDATMIHELPSLEPVIIYCQECTKEDLCAWRREGAKYCSYAERRTE